MAEVKFNQHVYINDDEKIVKNQKDILKLKERENFNKKQNKELLSYFESIDRQNINNYNIIKNDNKHSIMSNNKALNNEIINFNIHTTKNKNSKDKIKSHYNLINNLDYNNINNVHVKSAKNSIYNSDHGKKMFQQEFINSQPNLLYKDILTSGTNKKALSKFASKKSGNKEINLIKIEKNLIENKEKVKDGISNNDNLTKLSKFNSCKNNKKVKNNNNSPMKQEENAKNYFRSSSIFHFDHSINNFKTQYNKLEKEDDKSADSVKLNVIQYESKVLINKSPKKKDSKTRSSCKLILNENIVLENDSKQNNLEKQKGINDNKNKDKIITKNPNLKLNLNFLNNNNEISISSNEANIDSKSAKPFIKRFQRDEREKEVFNTDCFNDIYSIKFENSFGTITDNIKLIPLESNRISHNKQTSNTKGVDSENIKSSNKEGEERKKPKKNGCFAFCF